MKRLLPPMFVISGKDPTVSPGGYAAYSHNLCRILRKIGYPVYILAAGKKSLIKQSPLGEVHLVENLLSNLLPVLGSVEMAMMPAYAHSFRNEIISIIKKNRYEKIYIWGMGPWSFAGVLVKKSHPKTKLLASYFTTFRHEMVGSLQSILTDDYALIVKLKYLLISSLGTRIFSRLENDILRSADIIVTHYRSTERILRDEFHTGADKIKRIPYYVEVFKRSESDLYTAGSQKRTFPKPIILTVCRQDARKGLNFLIHAVQLLNSKHIPCSLVIVGSGSLLKAHKLLANRFGLNNIFFLGYQPKIDDLYRQTDVFVLSSTEEGSGSLSLLEAMRERLPIVSTNVDGISEDIKNNQSALLVDPASPKKLADALENLLENPRRSMEFGLAARQAYEKKFSFEKMEQGMKNLLSRV